MRRTSPDRTGDIHERETDTNNSHRGLGRVGIWTMAFDWQPAGLVRDATAELEELGYGAVWYAEGLGRDAVSQAWLILGNTRRLVVGAGVANIAVRDPIAMAAAHRALDDAYAGRFVLGLGGHRTHDTPANAIPGRYGRPVQTMTAYLDAMDAATTVLPEPTRPRRRRVLAALGPKMTELAAQRTEGALPYFAPVEHTRRAREAMGPGPLLAVELAVALTDEPDLARRLARDHVAYYTSTAPHQAANLRRLGFSEQDMRGPSSTLVDAVVAHGNLDAVRTRVREHLDAGADHVCIQVLTADPATLPLHEWRELAFLATE
ncbi:TIGR03620 family F420-dependent LLM class oxidoreductase [Salinispora pacifica]|uniref:TIGR03620 family F420-dependent LLM class oxidoreductase n=1 Tax=Salinispora pacifica TaxID=351187 RepID=UPI000485A262|nr:TIGR03620 family F420-dependent LLM class oxidoreductase [Salinispora pacifica]